MLNCRDVAHEASDYIDHNQTGWRRFWFNVHLFICKNCRVFVRHVNTTKEFIRKRGGMPASEQEVKGVMEAVRKADSK
ncbi:zf-HC2 domain-containing protein [Ketobacter alkanivorans]|uniref:Putative zinc-finger domain-containing protein n=1 Tax=Ketobacter alkanivorans TaxID=1917421 RepID=A0A2K9LKE2_9GAMM|nr:hypothetical protein [Ketobacter alkanivorans]AUM12707.1 hypothetical protein Kalk_09890 [Ketobacter alkanivorans]MCP5013661.1 hypothetical protein [Ketobacter sp.]